MNEEARLESFCREDCPHIRQDDLTPELAQAPVAGIVALLKLKAHTQILLLACDHGKHATRRPN